MHLNSSNVFCSVLCSAGGKGGVWSSWADPLCPTLTFCCWATINRSKATPNISELTNIPSAPRIQCCLIVFYYLCSTPQRLGHSKWCYCETNQRGKSGSAHEGFESKASAMIVSNQARRKTSTQMVETTNIPVECGCSVDIVPCVYCLVSLELATTSYPALTYFRAVHRRNTDQDVQEKYEKQQQWKKSKWQQSFESMSILFPAVPSNNSCSHLCLVSLNAFLFFLLPKESVWPSKWANSIFSFCTYK